MKTRRLANAIAEHRAASDELDRVSAAWRRDETVGMWHAEERFMASHDKLRSTLGAIAHGRYKPSIEDARAVLEYIAEGRALEWGADQIQGLAQGMLKALPAASPVTAR